MFTVTTSVLEGGKQIIVWLKTPSKSIGCIFSASASPETITDWISVQQKRFSRSQKPETAILQ